MLIKWDQLVSAWLRSWQNPHIGWLMYGLSAAVDYGFWHLLTLYFLAKKDKTGFWYLGNLLFSSLLQQGILKRVFGRLRPCQIQVGVAFLGACPLDYSFPSGHATISFAAATFLFWLNRKLGIFAYLLAGLVAYSRVYLGVHYLGDITVGALLGCLLATLCYKLMKKTENKNKGIVK